MPVIGCCLYTRFVYWNFKIFWKLTSFSVEKTCSVYLLSAQYDLFFFWEIQIKSSYRHMIFFLYMNILYEIYLAAYVLFFLFFFEEVAYFFSMQWQIWHSAGKIILQVKGMINIPKYWSNNFVRKLNIICGSLRSLLVSNVWI